MPATLINELVSRGRIVDLVLAVMAAEVAFLLLRPKSGGRRGLLADLLLTFAPGVCLLLALRASLTGQDGMAVAGWLAASLPFHLADLARRFRR